MGGRWETHAANLLLMIMLRRDAKPMRLFWGGGLLLASLPISFPFMDELSAEPTRSVLALALLALHPQASCFRECI